MGLGDQSPLSHGAQLVEAICVTGTAAIQGTLNAAQLFKDV